MKYALVTGASSGIGFEVCKNLANRGYKVLGCTIAKEVEKMAPLKELGVVSIECDISSVSDIKKMAQVVEEETGGRLDILYNIAGILIAGAAVEFDDLEAKKLFDVNVLGHIYVTKYMINYVILAKGTIIFTSSVAARVPLLWVSLYCATKAAIDQYALGLHGEMKHYGVRVISVITGGVDTAICDNNVNYTTDGGLFDVPAARGSMISSAMMLRQQISISPKEYAKQVLGKAIGGRGGFNVYAGGRAYFLHLVSRFVPLWLMEWGISFHFKQLSVWAQLRKKLRDQSARRLA